MASVSRMWRKELVAQAFALAGASHQAGDVDELDDGRQDALGLDDLGQRLQPRVGQLDHADVGLDGAERVVLGGDAGLGQGVEQGGLADVGQADDAALQAHGGLSDRDVTAQRAAGASRAKPAILGGLPTIGP
jgi:hypothetical protein